MPGPIALQLEYSLVERSIEREHVPAARALGLGIVPWSPLAGGFLAGKYSREGSGATGDGRLGGSNPFGDSKFTDRNWGTLDVLRAVAAEVDRPMSQVALAWICRQPGISTILLGTRTEKQLQDNLASLEVEPGRRCAGRLNEASAIELGFPYAIYTDDVLKSGVSTGARPSGVGRTDRAGHCCMSMKRE